MLTWMCSPNVRVAKRQTCQCADECPLSGAKRTLTNRCLPISIYEYTAERHSRSCLSLRATILPSCAIQRRHRHLRRGMSRNKPRTIADRRAANATAPMRFNRKKKAPPSRGLF